MFSVFFFSGDIHFSGKPMWIWIEVKESQGRHFFFPAPSREKVETCIFPSVGHIYFLVNPLWGMPFKWSWFHAGIPDSVFHSALAPGFGFSFPNTWPLKPSWGRYNRRYPQGQCWLQCSPNPHGITPSHCLSLLFLFLNFRLSCALRKIKKNT